MVNKCKSNFLGYDGEQMQIKFLQAAGKRPHQYSNGMRGSQGHTPDSGALQSAAQGATLQSGVQRYPQSIRGVQTT
jgi:hypothetical protein